MGKIERQLAFGLDETLDGLLRGSVWDADGRPEAMRWSFGQAAHMLSPGHFLFPQAGSVVQPEPWGGTLRTTAAKEHLSLIG